MSKGNAYAYFRETLEDIKNASLYKDERIITSPQGAWITVEDGRKVLNMCANNYLGLSSHPAVIETAKKSYDEYGYGMSSVRFICGTLTVHKQLERKLTDFLETEDTILYSSCFDANGGVFETLLGKDDAIISDELNHASIIDGIRLCKAQRYIYRNNDMNDLEEKLQAASGARIRLIATDGVFSMDGTIADLENICRLARKYDALVMVDDSHATGFMGKRGKGTHEYCNVIGQVDIITSTLGKALGGASGGFISGSREIIELLRQRSRPYLFSNTLAPAIAYASCAVLDMISADTTLRDKLFENTRYFRTKLKDAGLDIPEGTHPIVPIMVYDSAKVKKLAEEIYEKGVYVVGFTYPVVPEGKARIRTQLSAAHSKEDLDFAISVLTEVIAP